MTYDINTISVIASPSNVIASNYIGKDIYNLFF